MIERFMVFPDFLTFGLLAAAGFGCGDFFGALASRKTNPKNALFWTFLFLALFWLAFGFWNGSFVPLSAQGYAMALATGFFFLVGDFLFLRATKNGKITVAAPILALSSVVTVALAILVLGEKPSGFQVVAGIVAVMGGVLVGLKDLRMKEVEKSAVLLLPAIVSHGIALTLAKVLIDSHGVLVGVSWFESLMVIFLLPFLMVNRKQVGTPVKENLGSALSYFAVFLGFATAASIGLLSLAAPVANLFPLFAVLLAVLVYREELNQHQ